MENRPKWLTVLAIILVLQGVVIFIVAGISLFGEVAENQNYGPTQLAFLILWGVVSITIARGIFKAISWSCHFLIAGGLLVSVIGFLLETDPKIAWLVLLPNIGFLGLLAWALYGTIGAIHYYDGKHDEY